MPTKLSVDSCPVCGRSDFSPIDLGEGCVLQRCRACNTVAATEYADPDEVYTEGYLFGESEWSEGPGRWGMDIRKEPFQRFLERVSERRMTMIEAATDGPGAMLDVGCGTGETLNVAQDRGWAVQGVEPEASAAEFARDRGVDVHIGLLQDADLRPASYDAVTAFHVLEHVPDPPGFLRGLARMAKPGGVVVIEVPNFESLDRRRTNADWRGIRPGEHITHFTRATLKLALDSSGLEALRIRTPTWAGRPQRPYDALAGFGFGPDPEEAMAKALRARTHPRVVEAVEWFGIRVLDALCDRIGVGMNLVALARVPARAGEGR